MNTYDYNRDRRKKIELTDLKELYDWIKDVDLLVGDRGSNASADMLQRNMKYNMTRTYEVANRADSLGTGSIGGIWNAVFDTYNKEIEENRMAGEPMTEHNFINRMRNIKNHKDYIANALKSLCDVAYEWKKCIDKYNNYEEQEKIKQINMLLRDPETRKWLLEYAGKYEELLRVCQVLKKEYRHVEKEIGESIYYHTVAQELLK